MTTQNFKTDLQVVKFLINQSGSSTWHLEKLTGISRQTFDRWKKAESLDVRGTTMQDFAEKLGYRIERNYNGIAVSPHNKDKNKENNEMELYKKEIDAHNSTQKQLIDMQGEKIKELEKALRQKNANPIAEMEGYENTRIDVTANLSKGTRNLDVCFERFHNIHQMSKALGYSISELTDIFALGQMINYKDHPIHTIRSNSSKIKMVAEGLRLLAAMALTRGQKGTYERDIKTTYIDKNGKEVKALNTYIINQDEETAEVVCRFLDTTEYN